MCSHCSEHTHTHSHGPEIVQIMPVSQELYAVYKRESPLKYAAVKGDSGLNLVPVLFFGLIRHGEKTMVEGFFASDTIHSCEDIQGFKGYASSLEHAEKLYT
ncbi:MAG: hypothetical protein U9P10_02100 [Thermodesulfobacteriota bacterium]|nr:hypothetical protein [Thermodesulfobacteriota bacterium]